MIEFWWKDATVYEQPQVVYKYVAISQMYGFQMYENLTMSSRFQ